MGGFDWDEPHEWSDCLSSCIQTMFNANDVGIYMHFHVAARSPRALEETARIHAVLLARVLGYNPRVRYPDLEEGTLELGEGFE